VRGSAPPCTRRAWNGQAPLRPPAFRFAVVQVTTVLLPPEAAEVPAALADHLTGAGFAVDLRRGPGVAGVVATQGTLPGQAAPVAQPARDRPPPGMASTTMGSRSAATTTPIRAGEPVVTSTNQRSAGSVIL